MVDKKQYKDTQLHISKLGFGCMRFPVKDGYVDIDKTCDLIAHAMQSGINYYDSGYFYQGGQSEKAMGQAFKPFKRSEYIITTKLPNFACSSEAEIYNTIDEQLKRCQTDYFDFYLLHNVNERSLAQFSRPYVVKALEKLKQDGKIRGTGFSSHANVDTLKWFADYYDWDIAQIQLNRFDWQYLDSQGQYEELTKRGIPVVVMEPLRGGRLASISEEGDKMLKSLDPDKSIASYSFRFAGALPNVSVVLSGMNEMFQLEDNVKTFTNLKPLSGVELETFDRALDALLSGNEAPCTKCEYCLEGCPMQLDIPGLIDRYNSYMVSRHFMEMTRISWMPEDKQPKSCSACGQCAEACPQNIDIPAIMEKLANSMQRRR
ncbi:MAG: aldo/keto reductase [Eubacteriaceae bacterium]|nr:aldo/keto reductase [Eubacteriaceae bacterium]